MIVRDFEGRTHRWPPTGRMPHDDEVEHRSSHHLRARNLLRRLFGTQRILEEVPLPGTKLILDFFIPLQYLAIEVQGQQHYQYNPFFHGSKWGFLQSRGNDRRKREWCEINNIRLIELPHTESDEEWIERLTNRDVLQ
jgi:hypothetical protein